MCTTPATAKISTPRMWGLSRGKPAPHRAERAFSLPRKQRGGGTEREREKLAQGLLRETGTGVLAGNGCGGSCAQHTFPPPRCCARRLSLTQGPASLIILFLSAFSHLPPSLGSASRRWVDGRLSGAAASPTASPACLTKPAQGFLPFWAQCFSLQAQVTGKSLVFRDSSEHPLSSAHNGNGKGWQDHNTH